MTKQCQRRQTFVDLGKIRVREKIAHTREGHTCSDTETFDKFMNVDQADGAGGTPKWQASGAYGRLAFISTGLRMSQAKMLQQMDPNRNDEK